MSKGKFVPRLHPADAERHFAPAIRTGGDLRSPAFFQQPALRRRPDNVTDALADRCVDGMMQKACAGMKHQYRASGNEVRQAFQDCQFQGRVMGALIWALPGIREDQMEGMFPLFGLSMQEMAEGFRFLCGEGADGYANHINLMADEALSPPAPSASPWLQRGHVSCILTREDLTGGMAPPPLWRVQEGDPRRSRCVINGRPHVIVSLGRIHYYVDESDWRRCVPTGDRHASAAPQRETAPCA